MVMPREARSCGLLIAAASLTIYLVVPSGAVYARQPSGTEAEPASTPTAKDLTDLAEKPAPLPVLSDDDAKRVEELGKKIRELREQAKYAEAVPMAEQVLFIRLPLSLIPYCLSTKDLRFDRFLRVDTFSSCEIKGWSVSWVGYGWH